MIETRKIHLTSDCGHYEIIAKLVSEQDSYTQDNWMTTKTYTGSHWNVSMKKDGKRVDWIISVDGNHYVHFGEYGTGLCPYNMKLNKNTILYGALITERFEKELVNINREQVEKRWCKEYVQARVNNAIREMERQ